MNFKDEHEFYVYWLTRLEQEGTLQRQNIEEMLRHNEWHYAIGDIVGKICQRGGLKPDDANWLLEVLPSPSWAHDQVEATTVLQNASLDYQSQLTRLLDLRADWAAYKILSLLPLDQVVEAQRIILASKRPKGARHDLLSELKRHVKRAHSA